MFLLVSALTGVATYYIYRLAYDSKQIIKDNYASLQYCRELQRSIDQVHQFYMLNVLETKADSAQLRLIVSDHRRSVSSFEKYLKLEEKNITEAGENDAVNNLRESFEDYMDTFKKSLELPYEQSRTYLLNSNLKYNIVKNNIVQIYNINLNAMNQKSAKAGMTGEKAVLYVSILGAFAFLFSFSFVINFPGAIGNPIIEITRKIKEIANRNYDERIEIRSRDELGEMAEAFNSMASRLKEYEKSTLEELLTEKSRIEAIVKNMEEGIILLDDASNIKVINPVAASLLGIEPKDWLNKSASEVAVSNDLFRDLIKDIKGENREKSGSLRITVQNEENFFIKDISKIKRINPEDGTKEKVGYIISLRNVTEFKKLDLAKTNFIAIISHELKTPISSINLSLKLIQDERVGALNEEQKKLVSSVKDDTLRLSKITKELLDISQVETGNIRLNIQETEPDSIVSFGTEALRTQLDDKDIQLEKFISFPLPRIKADIEKTVWVMTNLLANAIRYTQVRGKIIVSVHHTKGEVQFSVEDKGPGIDERNMEKIFKRFVQIDGNSRGGGVGLGLAISKEFIQEQGGKIWVESEIGIGSKFIFTLPVV